MKRTGHETYRCKVCNAENSQLRVICEGCGAYLQDRVASLHLFETVWQIIESPSAALKRIIVAQQKNYVVLLQVLFGIAYVAFLFWYTNAGILIRDLQLILGLILLLGPPVGMMSLTILSLVAAAVLRTFGSAVKVRDIRAAFSYAAVPIIISVVVIFPVEVGLFGIYLFTDNPSPFVMNPVIYSLILVLDAALIVWSIVLLYIAVRYFAPSRGRAVTLTVTVVVCALMPVRATASIISIMQVGL